MTADAAAILGRTGLLRSAPTENLRPVAAACRVRNIRRGQAAFTRDDPVTP